ncbi:histidine phosphatase family protein [Nocardioides halotolerans]|uniref:histidine phosphatase family protein n=1 Tax=Nocardioides halotolerans TaxID=433660 RepID=UPI000417A8C7|nr:histidine phosphatase family protein [Nocardioides halotolerans]
MVDLVLLRHGRTDWNAARRIQGQADSQLDELGHAQAEAVAPVLAALSPAVLWSSDSDRARSTASYVAAACGLAPTFDPRLREYSLGPREGLFHHEFEAEAPEEYARFIRADWDAVTGAEKLAEVAARMVAAVSEAVATVPSDGVALVVSHGSAIRTCVAALLGWDSDEALTLHGMDNCGWAVLRRRTTAERWRLHAYNRTVPVPRVPPDLGPAPAVG